MTDTFKRSRRSEIMRSIKPKNTSPELEVRSMVRRLGWRFRSHVKELPGTPDLVLPRLRKIVLVHGCFWHCHSGCKKSGLPKSNVKFWRRKLLRNKERDRENRRALRKLGWSVLVIWQCELRNHERITQKLKEFLKSGIR